MKSKKNLGYVAKFKGRKINRRKGILDMPKDIKEAVKLKIEDIEKNGLDFDDVLEVKKITEKKYNSSYEKNSFKLLLTFGGPNIWLIIDEDEAKIFRAWAFETDEEPIEIAGLYDELLEIYQ